MVSWRNFLSISSYHHHKEIFMYIHLLSSLILKLLQKLFRMGIVWKLLTVFNQIGLSLLHPNKNILALNLDKIRVIVLILVYFLLKGISLTFLKITNSFPQFFLLFSFFSEFSCIPLFSPLSEVCKLRLSNGLKFRFENSDGKGSYLAVI